LKSNTTGHRALILVDLQNDFVVGGALAASDGMAVVEITNRLMADFDLVVATQDWHPADHKGFASKPQWEQPFLIQSLLVVSC